MGRNTQGVRVIDLKQGDSIADVTRVADTDEPEAEEDDASDAEEEPAATNGEMDDDTASDAVEEAEDS
jgi:DNA gyrase subunit A